MQEEADAEEAAKLASYSNSNQNTQNQHHQDYMNVPAMSGFRPPDQFY